MFSTLQCALAYQTAVFVQMDGADWYDENVPSSEGFRSHGDDEVVQGHICIEVLHLMTVCIARPCCHI